MKEWLPVDVSWKGLDRSIRGGLSNEEIRAAFPEMVLDDEWLNERRKQLDGEPEKARSAAVIVPVFTVPEHIQRMERAIGVLAETIDNADDMYRLAEAAHIVANAKMTERDIQLGEKTDKLF